VRIGWREHARVGVPVTLATLAVAAAWLALLQSRFSTGRSGPGGGSPS
jgi:hypothetical protein